MNQIIKILTIYFIVQLVLCLKTRINISQTSNSHSQAKNTSTKNQSNPFDLIKQIHFTKNNSIFFMTQDSKQFGYIDRSQGYLYNLFELGQHQKIINLNEQKNLLVIRNQQKSLTFFNYQQGEQIINDKSQIFQQDESFDEILSYIQIENSGFYLLTNKDLRYCNPFPQKNAQIKQTIGINEIYSQERDIKQIQKDSQLLLHQQDRISQRNKANQEQHNKMASLCRSSEDFKVIHKISQQEKKILSFQQQFLNIPYDLALLKSTPSNEDGILILMTLHLSRKEKKICFYKFDKNTPMQQSSQYFNKNNKKCHIVNNLNIKSIHTSQSYLYIKFNSKNKKNGLFLKQTNLTEQWIQKYQQIFSQYQQKQNQQQKLWEIKQSQTLVVNLQALQPVKILKKQIQQYEHGNAIFFNHQSYSPKLNSYFQERLIKTNGGTQFENDDLRAVVNKREIWLLDYSLKLNVNKDQQQMKSQTKSIQRQDQLYQKKIKMKSLESQKIKKQILCQTGVKGCQKITKEAKKLKLERFVANIIKQQDETNLQPISIYAYVIQEKQSQKLSKYQNFKHYLVLIQYSNYQIVMYDLSMNNQNNQELNKRDEFVKNNSMNEDILDQKNKIAKNKTKSQSKNQTVNSIQQNNEKVQGYAQDKLKLQKISSLTNKNNDQQIGISKMKSKKLWEIDSLSKLVSLSQYQIQNNLSEEQSYEQEQKEVEDSYNQGKFTQKSENKQKQAETGTIEKLQYKQIQIQKQKIVAKSQQILQKEELKIIEDILKNQNQKKLSKSNKLTDNDGNQTNDKQIPKRNSSNNDL